LRRRKKGKKSLCTLKRRERKDQNHEDQRKQESHEGTSMKRKGVWTQKKERKKSQDLKRRKKGSYNEEGENQNQKREEAKFGEKIKGVSGILVRQKRSKRRSASNEKKPAKEDRDRGG